MSDAYFSQPGCNWSLLKLIDESPLAYRHALTSQRPDTTAFAIGRLTHTLTFEPEKFGAEYAVWEGGDRRGNEWKAFEAANAGKTIFKPNEIAECQAMANAVRRHPLVAPLLDGGAFERVVTWVDSTTGIACKAKIDWQVRDILIDLKTCRSIERRRFAAEAARYQYHGQLAHYSAGCELGLGITINKRILIAVEKSAPYDVGVFVLDDDACRIGDEKQQELLAKLKACMDTDSWPGRYTDEQELELPGWVHGADDLSITFDEE